MNCNEPESTEVFIQPSALKDRAFIEIPCPTSWEKMTGNDSVRFCGQCSLNVYNISNMTDKEAEAVFAKGQNGERLCARLYRRPDGTVMTDNCPRALRRIRNASRWLKTKIVACFGLLLSLSAPAQAESPDKTNTKNGSAPKCSPVKEKINKDKAATDKSVKEPSVPMHTMGAIRVPSPAEQAELGKVAVPVKAAPVAPAIEQPATPAHSSGIMGRVRVNPLPVKQVKPADKPTNSSPAPASDQKAK